MLKKILTDAKTWVVLISIAGVALANIFDITELPGKVASAKAEIDALEEKVKTEVEVVDDKVQDLAHSVDKYIAVQTTKQEAFEDREKMLIEILKSIKGANNGQ